MNAPEITPAEKAQRLLRRFLAETGGYESPEGVTLSPENYAVAQNCAIACVDFIYEFMKDDDDLHECASNANSQWVDYYQRVLKELKAR
jgi:hypothetical protein